MRNGTILPTMDREKTHVHDKNKFNTINEQFKNIVTKFPECIAVSEGMVGMTYRALDQASNKIATSDSNTATADARIVNKRGHIKDRAFHKCDSGYLGCFESRMLLCAIDRWMLNRIY